jgi:signal transduction histidine kinase
MIVRAEEFSLEDVVTHILRNAQRHRTPGTPITMELLAQEPGAAQVVIHNQGQPIADALLTRVFEYGVSGTELSSEPAATGQRGQGLFVARTYMRKMGGAIEARNEDGGVSLVLTLQRTV